MTQAHLTAPAQPAPTQQARMFVKYTFFKVRPEWRRLPRTERAPAEQAVRALLASPPEGVTLRSYNLVGIRGDADFLLWTISESLSAIQELVTRLLSSPLGGYVDIPYSYLAMTQKSQYLGGHQHPGQEGASLKREPKDAKFLFVYPFWKKRDWYSLPMEERQRMMGAHFRIGHKYPNIKIHTGYSFGLDDQEFMLGFEGDDPGEFLDLVQELRGTEASKFTEWETPIFTCPRATPEELVRAWGGEP